MTNMKFVYTQQQIDLKLIFEREHSFDPNRNRFFL